MALHSSPLRNLFWRKGSGMPIRIAVLVFVMRIECPSNSGKFCYCFHSPAIALLTVNRTFAWERGFLLGRRHRKRFIHTLQKTL